MDTEAIKQAFRTEYNAVGVIPRPSYQTKPRNPPPAVTTTTAAPELGKPEYNKYAYKLFNNPGNEATPSYKWVKVTPNTPPSPVPAYINNSHKQHRAPVPAIQQLLEKLLRDKKKALARLIAKQNQVKHQNVNPNQYFTNIPGPGSVTGPKYRPIVDTGAAEVSEDVDDIESVIENMPVTIQTMNTLKEILNLQTKKTPSFSSETFSNTPSPPN